MNRLQITDGRDYLPQPRPIRTVTAHPHSHDPFYNWKRTDVKANGSVYTDRLLQWDWDKHNCLSEKHFGDRAQVLWGQRDPAKVEAFLRDWNEDLELVLVAIIQYVNHASGFPLWRLDYRS